MDENDSGAFDFEMYAWAIRQKEILEEFKELGKTMYQPAHRGSDATACAPHSTYPF